MLKPLTVWIITKCGKLLKEMAISVIPSYLSPEKFVCRLELDMNNGLVQNWERNMSRLYIFTLLTYTLSTSWEIPGWMSYKLKSKLAGKHQQPQLGRWYHCNGRKWGGTKDPLNKGEGGKWKRQLKLNIKKNQQQQLSSWHSGPITSW